MKHLKRNSIRLPIASLGILLAVSAARALPPRTIPFQGKLTNTAGQPVTAATSVTISLYTAASGGTAVWSETKSMTPSSTGVFSTLLGSATAFPASVAFDQPYYVGVKIGSDAEMTGRVALASVPYALALPNVTVTTAGNVGIGTTTPGELLQLNGRLAFQKPAGDEQNAGKLDYRGFDAASLSIIGAGASATNRNVRVFDTLSVGYSSPTGGVAAFNGNVGVGTASPQSKLDVKGRMYVDSGSLGGAPVISLAVGDTDTGLNSAGDGALDVYANNVNVMRVRSTGVGVGGVAPAGVLFSVSGIAQVNRLKIVGGSDVAEPYTVAAAGSVKPVAGIVVSIDPDHTGRLRVCSTAYDGAVAGIVSGANGVQPGLTLTQTGTDADGDLPIANTGRVWCYSDADANGPIQPGDMLTSSPTPGYAMKATDRARSYGAVLGKAMSRLSHGQGFVLVLVGLQ